MTLVISGIKFYTTLETAQQLSVTVPTVRDYIKKGKIKAQRVGKSFLISECSLMEFLKVDGFQVASSKK